MTTTTTATGWLPSGQPAPIGTLAIHRDLHDGASYDLTAAAPGVTTLAIRDADGTLALISLDRAGARQLGDDIKLAAGLQPTGATVDLATALGGSLRIALARIDDELPKVNPAAADQLRATVIAHLRSTCPQLVAGGAL